MTAALQAFFDRQLPAFRKLVEIVRYDDPPPVLVALDNAMPLAAEWILPRVVEQAEAGVEGEGAALYSIAPAALATILRLEGAPVAGSLRDFLRCADDIDAGRVLVVTIAEDGIEWRLRDAPGWGTVRGDA